MVSMTLNNGMEMEIKRSWYNKTKVQDDGVTHIVDPKQYIVYQFGMAKNYFDAESKQEAVQQIIDDLQSTISQLQEVLKQDKEQEIEEGR